MSTKVDPQKLDFLSLGRYLFIYSVVSVNRIIVRYNKYLVVVTVVVAFVSFNYCYSYCYFVRTFYSRYWCVQEFKFEYPIYSIFRKKSLIVLGLFQYKY